MRFKAKKICLRGKLSIGERLKRARKRKNITLAEAEEATKIRTKYLEALENNQYDNLPNDVYVRGFIQSYGALLGLDGRELVEHYNREKDVKIEAESRILPPTQMRQSNPVVITPKMVIISLLVILSPQKIG